MFLGKKKVGIIGLGIIGSRVAERLRRADVHVYVWSRTPKPEPNFLSSPMEMASLAEVIQIFVTDGNGLLEVVEQIVPHLTSRHIVLNHATVGVESVKKAAEMVMDTGASFGDCPFTGSKTDAQNGDLVYFFGGNPDLIGKVKGVLSHSGKDVIHMGQIGDATILKIATNLMVAANVQALAEALGVVRAKGIDPDRLLEALRNSAVDSGVIDMKLPSMIAADYDPHYTLKNMFKDAQFALSLANESGLELPVLASTASAMFNSIRIGKGDLDFSVLATNYPTAANETIEDPEETQRSLGGLKVIKAQS